MTKNKVCNEKYEIALHEPVIMSALLNITIKVYAAKKISCWKKLQNFSYPCQLKGSFENIF